MAGSSRIDELRKKFDENPRRYFAPLANEYRKLGDFDQAIFICQEFLPQQPGHMSGHIVYGQALFEGGRHEEARTVFETALTLDPENLIALRHLGDIARASGDLVSARGWYQRVLDADPRNDEIAEILNNLGGASPSAEAPTARDAADAAPTPSSAAQGGSSPSGEAPVETPAVGAPPKSSVSDFAALIEEVRAEAAAEASANEAPASSPPAAAHATPPIEGLQGAFTEAPSAAPTRARDESDLDALFDLSAAPADTIVEKTSDPTSGLRGSAASAEPLADLVTDGAATASSAAAAAGAFVTETMAELYLSQGHREEALGVYRQLVDSRPGDEALRARLTSLEAESDVAAPTTGDASPPTESPSRPSGRSIREFLGDIAARRPRANGSQPSEASEQSSSSSGNELPFLTDIPATSTASTSASPESTAPMLPDLGAEVGGLSSANIPAASRRADPPQRDTATSVAGSLGALFAEAESPERGAGVVGGSVTAESLSTPETRGHGHGGSRESVTGEHAPLPGRPTQPAATELSLDYVFRHVTPAKGTPGQPNFSFDQFFSQESQQDAATSGGEPPREPTTDESDDIQQFNAWLEGLKKS